MIAGWYERNGPAAEVLQVGEMPDPEPGLNEVRVKVHAAGINPSDVKGRQGLRKKIAFARVIPGCDGAGVIDRIGAGVPAARLGERVWVYEGQFNRAMGTSAGYVVLPTELAVRLPEAMSFEQGACLGVPYLTAHRAVFADGAVTGLTVLVQGGAGGVAHYAIQLCKWAGAQVITTVSGPGKAAHATLAGADHVINYKTESVKERVLAITGGRGVDRVIEMEFGQNVLVDYDVIAPYGTIACYGSQAVPDAQLPYFSLNAKNPLIRLILVYTMPLAAKQQAISDLPGWLQAGKTVFAIAKRFDLASIAAAHETVEGGDKIGQVVLNLA